MKRRSLHGSVLTVGSQLAKMAIQVASQIIVARLLFPSDFGLIAMVSPLVTFIGVFNDIGLGQAIVQRASLEQSQVSSLFWVNIGLSFMLVLIVALAAPLAALVYREPRVIPLMIVFGTLIPLSALGIHPGALLSRQMRFGWMAGSEVAALIVTVVVTTICAWQGWSYWSLVAGQGAGTMVSVALAWMACGWRPSFPKITASSWVDLKFGGNLTGANLATFATIAGDNMIVGVMAGRVALGLYDRSYRLVVQPLGQIVAPISRVAVPLLSRLGAHPDEYRATYFKMFRALLLTTVPAMLVCVTDGATMIHVFLGNRWTQAGPIFSWICVGGLTAGINSSAYWLFISQGRVRELRHVTTIAAIINVASFLAGAALWGIIGVAALGSLGYVSLTTPLMLYVATRTGPVPFSQLIGYAVPFFAQSAVVYAMLVFAERQLAIPGLGQVVLITALSYLCSLAFAFLRTDDRELFRDGWRMMSPLLKR